MKKRTYKFADVNIEISAQFDSVHRLCRNYLTEEAPALFVSTTAEDIENERAKGEDAVAASIPDSRLEELAVYRKIAEQMPFQNTMLFHGSAVAVDGEAYLFAAKSGTGKSTHTGLWREYFGDRAVMVNDDKPLIRLIPSGAIVYGTPWDGKHRLSNNIAVPLRAICILERAQTNTIKEITSTEAYPMLLQQTYRPADAAAMENTLQLIDRLSDSVALFRLGCNRDIESVTVAYSGMRKVK